MLEVAGGVPQALVGVKWSPSFGWWGQGSGCSGKNGGRAGGIMAEAKGHGRGRRKCKAREGLH